MIKQFFSGSSNIYETVAPFYYVLKFFGLASFTLNLEDGTIRMKFKDYLLLFFATICGIFAIYSTCSDILTYLIEGTSLIQNVWKYLYLYQIIIIVPIIIFGYIKKQHVERFLELIHSFDKLIELLNWEHKSNHSKTKSKLFIWLTLSAFIIILMYSFSNLTSNYLSDSNFYLNILLNVFVVKLHDVAMCQFIFSVICIKDRYKILNKNMSLNFSLNKYRSKWSHKMVKNQIIVIKKTAHLHDLLYDSLTEINSIYSLQIIPILLSILMTQIFTMYTLLLVIRRNLQNNEDYMNLVNLLIWSVYQTVPIILAIYQASKTTEYGKQMHSIVGKIINNCDDTEVLNLLKLFSLQMQNHQPVLSCGFFPIDYTLAFLVAGSVTTYLVILCQFDAPV
ncbi:unnamed protein product [Diamesa serratosioi]